MEVPVPSELQAYQLFTARRVVDGRTIYEINLGYFSTRFDAERAQRVLAQRFPQATVVELTPQTPPTALAAVREPTPARPPAATPPGAPAPQPITPSGAPAPQPVTPSGALSDRMPTPPPVPVFPLPPPTPSVAPPPSPTTPAPAAAPPLPVTPVVPAAPPASETPAAAPVPVTPAPSEPAAPPTTAAAPQPPPAAPAEIDQQGRVLLAQGRAALDKGDYEQAVGLLNQLLNLPPNTASQDGQELIGVARARLGDATRARAEFELYLKLYPTGPGAERVRAELARLGTGTVAQRRPRVGAPITVFNGAFSQYYFGGRSQISQLREGTPLQGVPVPPTQDPISTVDQKQLQSSLDLNYRHRDADGDLRIVFRDVYTKNFLDNSRSFSSRPPNRLNAAYVEYKALPTGFAGKLGRQSPSGGDGVLYRFDGARLGYQFTPKLGVYAVAGQPSDDLYDAKRRFYGLSLAADNLFDHASAGVYGIQQTIDGQTDRRAIGTELRYFDPQTSVFGVYDYDTLFHALNIAQLQATWQALNNAATVTFLADRRTGPILTTGNALLVPDASGNIHRTITEYLQTLTIDQLRQLAKATTTYVNQEQLGLTVQTSPNVQIAGNASRTNIGALPAFDTNPACLTDPTCTPLVPAQPATGNIFSYGLQLISSNLYSERDSQVLSGSLLRGATFKGRLLSFNSLSTIGPSLQLEPSLRYFRQDNTDGSQITRWTPALRVTWRVTRKFSIEGDVDYETSKTRQPFDTTTGTTPVEKANRVFYFLGYRLEF
jgi:hypothetical protein